MRPLARVFPLAHVCALGLLLSAAVGLPSTASAQQTHLLIVSGLSGEPRFAAEFADWTRQLSGAATTRLGVPAANVHALSESGAGPERSTRDNVLAAVAALARVARPEDEVVLVLFGHGSESAGEGRLNLPGPDLTARDLAAALGALRARRVIVVNTASASGAFLKPLAAPGRIVLTATKSGVEQNETLFGGYFVAAAAGPDADADKDGRVSVLEAFDYARREVERAYTSTQRLQTEHPLLDADGDGVGSEQPVASSGDGAAAAQVFFGASGGAAVAAAPTSPELRGLLERKQALEAELTTLRGRKASMPEADYARELERLLLELSRNGQAIRRLEGGSQ